MALENGVEKMKNEGLKMGEIIIHTSLGQEKKAGAIWPPTEKALVAPVPPFTSYGHRVTCKCCICEQGRGNWKLTEGRRHPRPKSKEAREKYRALWSNPEYVAKMQQFKLSHAKRYKKGRYFSEKNNEWLVYSSSYELTAYEKLERDDNVILYRQCRRTIPYKFGGVIRRYLPDIEVVYADGDCALIEVKPLGRSKDEMNVEKMKALKDYCKTSGLQCYLWTEVELMGGGLKEE